jgi:hypothetical protein
MSLMRSWADCFLLKEPADSVLSRFLLRGKDGDGSGGAFCEDVDARPAIIHILEPKSFMGEVWRQCGLK